MNTVNMTLFKTAGANVRLRKLPAGELIGTTIRSGTTIQLSGKIEKAELDGVLYHWFELHSGGWFAYHPELSLILARPDPVQVPKPTPPPVDVKPVSMPGRGVHGNAGGWSPTMRELNIVRANNIKTVLIPAYEPGQTHAIDAYRNAGVENFIIRAAAHAGMITPDYHIWIQATLPRLRAYHDTLRRVGKTMYLQPFNEPNLSVEGFGRAWFSGAEFSMWLKPVIEIYRRELPGVSIGFPPLSPGPDFRHGDIRRQDEWVFTAGCADAIAMCDWFGVHGYYVREDAQDFELPLDKWRLAARGRSIILTEAGPADNVRVTRNGVLHMYAKCEAAGVPCMAWLLSGAGAWKSSDWTLHNVLL